MSHVIRILLAAALAAAAGSAWAEGDPARGAKKFEDCQACHALDRAGESLGPSLFGVFGRKAGEGTSFRYSPAMKRSGIVWTPQTIDTFITDPQAVVAANRMPYAGMIDAGDRADLIAFLEKTFK
jgi:cytochrome c